MSIALVIAEHRDAIDLMPWVVDLARVRQQDLQLVYLSRHASQRQRTLIRPDEGNDWGEYAEVVQLLEKANGRWAPPSDDTPEDVDSNTLCFHLVSIQHPTPVKAVCDELLQSDVATIVIRRESTHSQTLDKASITELMSDVPCELIQIRTDSQECQSCQTFMVPLGPDAHSDSALRLATQLCTRHKAKLTAGLRRTECR